MAANDVPAAGRRIADEFDQAARELGEEVRKVVSRAALNIKNDARDRISGARHLPHYPRSISYDVEETGDGPAAEIGPDHNRSQGPLGNLLEYGSVNNAPIPHLAPALDEEEPRFARALEAALAKVLGL